MGLTELRLHLLLGRHVVLHREVADDRTGVVEHRGDDGPLVVQASVAGSVHELAVPLLPGGEGGPHLVVDRAGRQAGLQDARIPADDLVGREPGDLGEPAVHVDDLAGEIGDDHRRRTLLHGLRELASLLLDPDTVRHVGDQRVQQRATLEADRSAEHLDVAHGPVRSAVTERERGAVAESCGLHLGVDLLGGEGVDVADPHRSETVAIPSVVGGGPRVGVDDLAGRGVDQEHHEVSVLEQGSIPGLGLLEPVVDLTAPQALRQHPRQRGEGDRVDDQHRHEDVPSDVGGAGEPDHEEHGDHRDVDHEADDPQVAPPEVGEVPEATPCEEAEPPGHGHDGDTGERAVPSE